MRLKKIFSLATHERSVDFEKSFGFHCFDQNSNKTIVTISALKCFVAFWGLPGSFLELLWDLSSNMIYKEAYRKPPKVSRKPQGSYKNFQGRNHYNIFFAILVETKIPKRNFEINWPLVIEERCSFLKDAKSNSKILQIHI